jgi:hypothetical protein
MDSTVCVFRGCLTCGGMKVDVPGAFCGTAAAAGIGAAGVITMVAPLVLDDVAGLAAVVSTAGALPVMVLDGMVLVAGAPAAAIAAGGVSSVVAPMVLDGMVLVKSSAGCVNTGSVCF